MVLPVAGVAAPPTYNADACIGPLRSHLRQAAPNTPGQAGRTVAGFDAGRNWHPVRTTAAVANTFTAELRTRSGTRPLRELGCVSVRPTVKATP